MTTKYRVFNFVFDLPSFGEALKMVEPGEIRLVADMLDIDQSTLRNWRNGAYKQPFAHPNMHNFLNVCNLLDLDPRAFFVLENNATTPVFGEEK